ncbi:MAG TPA: PRC-barrel domain-containing protein [Longimicrobiales bacterium]|nr:PRC-barrel domain-containing protein [Longimicrobiales bacterium]
MRKPSLAIGEPQVALAELRTHGEYRVCKGNQDPRGWPLRTSDDREIGKISDLIIDEVALNARYLVCSYSTEGRRVLIPTGFARLDGRARVVHLDFITRQDLQRLPTYQGLPLSAEQQLDVESALTLREPAERESLIVRRDPETAE